MRFHIHICILVNVLILAFLSSSCTSYHEIAEEFNGIISGKVMLTISNLEMDYNKYKSYAGKQSEYEQKVANAKTEYINQRDENEAKSKQVTNMGAVNYNPVGGYYTRTITYSLTIEDLAKQKLLYYAYQKAVSEYEWSVTCDRNINNIEPVIKILQEIYDLNKDSSSYAIDKTGNDLFLITGFGLGTANLQPATGKWTYYKADNKIQPADACSSDLENLIYNTSRYDEEYSRFTPSTVNP